MNIVLVKPAQSALQNDRAHLTGERMDDTIRITGVGEEVCDHAPYNLLIINESILSGAQGCLPLCSLKKSKAYQASRNQFGMIARYTAYAESFY